MAASDGFRALDEKSLVEYIFATPAIAAQLGNPSASGDLQIKEVGDGNLNFVYIVVGPGGSVVIKQALPYVRLIGESWPMTKDRAYFEASALREHGRLCPNHVPEVYHFDADHSCQAYKQWILKTIEETWTFFQKKFITFWNDNRDEHGEAYLVSIYDNPELHLLAQKKYITELFHDSLGFSAAKMIRRIVEVAHVEDFESISDASKRALCERHALNCGKLLLKERRRFQTIEEVISVVQEFSAS